MRLFIIGNGFDLAHGLPTSFNPDFKNITEIHEQISDFWDIYQSVNSNIWSDFENCLAHPDFNQLEEIFRGYEPDFSSDYESDRNSIIIQVDLNGRLKESLYDFANRAEQEINDKNVQSQFYKHFNCKDLFISFNYTHTLEKLYKITDNQIVHIHGEVGKNNLLLGYEEGEFQPELYFYDPIGEGRGHVVKTDYKDYIDRMQENESIDFYTREACIGLYKKAKSFSKKIQLEKLKDFLKDKEVKDIIIIGHSCGETDYKYFEALNKKYPLSKWTFYHYNEDTKCRIERMTKTIGIKDVCIKQDEEL